MWFLSFRIYRFEAVSLRVIVIFHFYCQCTISWNPSEIYKHKTKKERVCLQNQQIFGKLKFLLHLPLSKAGLTFILSRKACDSKEALPLWLPTFFSCIWNFNDQVQLQTSSTLFNIDCYLQRQLNKNSNFNRLAHKIAIISNLNGPVKRKIKWKERTVLHPSTGYDHYSIRAALSVNGINMCNQNNAVEWK